MGYLDRCLKLVSICMVVTVVRLADWNGSDDYDPPRTNCDQGHKCAFCTPSKTGVVVLSSGYSVKVCCPGCSSGYFTYGWESDLGHPFCHCQYETISGTVWKGEECNVTGMTTYGSYTDMPLCCPDPLVMIKKGSNGSQLIVDCEKRGNCWRGSMCANCTGNIAVNDVPLCCPNCQDVTSITLGEACFRDGNGSTSYHYDDSHIQIICSTWALFLYTITIR